MPNLADIVVKKADGTTNVTFFADQPAAGDSSPARLVDRSAASRAFQPVILFRTRDNGPRTVRMCDVTTVFPYTVTSSTGAITVSDVMRFQGTFQIANAIPDTSVNEFVVQTVNLMVSPLIVSALKQRGALI